MALQDYYNTGDDQGRDVSTAAGYWMAMTWLSTSAYDAESIKIKIYRVGSPGTVTVSLYSISGGDPNSSLGSGTFNGDTVTTNTAGEWITITLSSSVAISNATMYAVVLDDANSSSGNSIIWMVDLGNGYADGLYKWTADSGSSWNDAATDDLMFEIHSASITYSELSGTIAAISTVTGNMVLGTTVELAGTIAVQSTVTGNMVLSTVLELSGTIAAVSTVGPSSLGSTTVGITTKTSYIKRLVAAGNNQIWYENI